MLRVDNLATLSDFYEFTMLDGFIQSGLQDTVGYYDIFFRDIPDGGGFVVAAGLESIIEYIKTLTFEQEDIAYFEKLGVFSDAFIQYIKNFKFTCDVWAVPEGTPVFPGEPLVVVRGPVAQAQMLSLIHI